MKKIISLSLAVLFVVGALSAFSVSAAAADGEWNNEFVDVKSWYDYYDAVEFCCGRAYMVGAYRTVFAPDETLTRGMLAQIIGSVAGLDLRDYNDSRFKDVAITDWCGVYVQYAADKNLMSGRADGTFDVYGAVTNEELMSVLYRYAQLIGKAGGKYTGVSLPFADAKKVSSSALEAVGFCAANGVYLSALALEPQSVPTRAQVSVIIMKFAQNVIDKSAD